MCCLVNTRVAHYELALLDALMTNQPSCLLHNNASCYLPQVESAESVNKAYTANENILNILQASGPSNIPSAPIGQNAHCWNPVSTGWQYQLMDGSSGQDITVSK
jgi:hypothetical protein